MADHKERIGLETANEEIFAMPFENGKYFLYAPLRRSLAVVNSACIPLVKKYLERGIQDATSEEQEILCALQEQGVLGGASPQPPLFPGKHEFCPHEVTLFLTSRCNLRCRYCYADAGKKYLDMPWEVAEAAIDLVARNAGFLGSKKFAVGFHGGGEPTLAWDLLVRCVEYAYQKADETGLDVEMFAATNGLLSPQKRKYIAEKFATVNISLDGPEDIQDFNRPTAEGGKSFAKVSDTLKYFDATGFRYGIRATITSATVDRMAEIVEKLGTEFKLDYLHMEPVWMCGRCGSSGEMPPSDEAFASNFLGALAKGRELGIDIIYSGSRLNVLTSKFCAAPGDGFSVLPEGIATSCFEVTEMEDPRAQLFHYGHYGKKENQFVFDQGRLERLRNLSVEHIYFCKDCFCKWHCAGDCLAKVFKDEGTFTHNGSTRCELNRTLTLKDLEKLVTSYTQVQSS